MNEWLEERRRIHNAATEGPWAIGSWRDRTFQHHMTIEPEVGSRTIGDVTDDHRGNADAIVDAHNTLPRALAALEKVLELHKPEEYEDPAGTFFCRTCGDWNMCEDPMGEQPDYPCPTVQSVRSAIERSE